MIWFTEGVKSVKGRVIHQLAGEVGDDFKMRCGDRIKGYNLEFVEATDYLKALESNDECMDCVYLEWKEQNG